MTVSICVPYWDRQVALDRMFAEYSQLYAGWPLEFAVCDDGTPIPAKVPRSCVITRLPTKDHPLNPCVPINTAVKSSTGAVVVLTNAEIMHRDAILPEMLTLLGKEEERRYVMARCRDVKTNMWLAGPAVDYTKNGRSPVPPGGHFHFLVMCWRSLWDKAGGFDEDYRNGQACDDNDWLWRLRAVGARFVTTEGVVWHQTSGLRWKLPSNRGLLMSKWHNEILTIQQGVGVQRDTHRNSPSDKRNADLRPSEGATQAGVRHGSDTDGRGSVRPGGVVAVPGNAERAAPKYDGAGTRDVGATVGNTEEQTVLAREAGATEGRPSGGVPDGTGSGEPGDVSGVHNTGVDTDCWGLTRRRPGLVHPEWALILGGGECVWDEVIAWEEIYGRPWDGVVVAANDVGSHWPRHLDHWCTLHPEKLLLWGDQRAAYGFNEDYVTWGRQRQHMDHILQPWAGGSSGMFAVQLSKAIGCTRAILCGIPMTPTPHFNESIPHREGMNWMAVAGHLRAWDKHLDKMVGWVKSMSGRTQQYFGEPTMEWLLEGEYVTPPTQLPNVPFGHGCLP